MKHVVQRFAVPVLAALWACAAGPASAQDDVNGRWYAAAMAGYASPDSDREYHYGINLQGVVGYDLFEALSLELNGFVTQNKREVDDRYDYTYGLGLDLNLGSAVAWQPFFLVGVGATREDYGCIGPITAGSCRIEDVQETYPYVNVGVGIYLPGFSPTNLTRLEARWNAVRAKTDDLDPNTAGEQIIDETLQDIRINIGMTFGAGHSMRRQATAPVEVVAVDTDGDGITDGIDACPDTPPDTQVDAHGCVPQTDTDGDGVLDANDRCPNTPPTVEVTAQGCPHDTDADGVTDDKDRCPGTAAGVKVDVNGCEPAADGDADGVPDPQDQCPGTPAGTAVDATGCPPVAAPTDADHDGVPDGADQCPGTPAEYQVDEKGCVQVQKVVLSGVLFALGSDQLAADANQALDSVAASLKQYPTLQVEVAGHTDSSGPMKVNMDLSKRRAASVRNYLVSKGVNPAQLTAEGYGPNQPIADNQTAEGRARNRRVEFRVIAK